MSDDSSNHALDGQYPDSWDEYIGQDSAKRALRIAAKSAAMRKANMDHVLIASPFAGIGKTALALLAIRTAGRRVLVVSGSMKISDVRLMFTRVEEGDIIFYDEIHKSVEGGKKNAEWMLHYLENGVLVTPFGEEKVPSVTLIGATTDKGLLPDSILQRFKVIDLVAYTDGEGAQIVSGLSRKILTAGADLPEVSDEIAAQIAAAASNQPRMMRKLLIAVRDLAITEEIPAPQDGAYDLTEALEFAGLTADGLTAEAQRYLVIMLTELRAEPAGAALMKERLGLVGNGLSQVEMLLLDKGLILKSKQGRVLTATGMKRAVALAA